jgi:hypothetical protein
VGPLAGNLAEAMGRTVPSRDVRIVSELSARLGRVPFEKCPDEQIWAVDPIVDKRKRKAMKRVVVETPTEVRFEGKSYGPGAEMEPPEEAARKWMAAGLVRPVSEGEAADKGLDSSEAPPEVTTKHEEDDGRRPGSRRPCQAAVADRARARASASRTGGAGGTSTLRARHSE